MAPDSFSRTRADYGDEFNSHVLDQYKVFVETEERLVSRRQEENRFFLSVNSLLLALLGFLIREGVDGGAAAVAVGILGIAGLGLCYAWWSIITSYEKLNRAKFEIIDQFERQVPVRMFGAEWEVARGPEINYEPFTKIERRVPFIFGALNFLATGIGVLGVLGILHFS